VTAPVGAVTIFFVMNEENAVSIYEIFNFEKIFSVLVDVFSVIAMLLSFLGVVALYRVRDKIDRKSNR